MRPDTATVCPYIGSNSDIATAVVCRYIGSQSDIRSCTGFVLSLLAEPPRICQPAVDSLKHTNTQIYITCCHRPPPYYIHTMPCASGEMCLLPNAEKKMNGTYKDEDNPFDDEKLDLQ